MNEGQQGWRKWKNKSYIGNINDKINKYLLQPMSIPYVIHQHITVNIDIKFTNI